MRVHRLGYYGCGAAFAVALACDAAPSTPLHRSSVPVEAASVSETAGQARVARRGRVVGGERVARRVRWPRGAQVDDELLASMPEPLRRDVAAAPGPVLLPSEAIWLEAGRLHLSETWAAFESHAEGRRLSVELSTQARLYPALRGELASATQDRLRGRAARVTRNEGIWSASWVERGVAYAVELECEADDPACENSDALIHITESMRWVGGRGVQPGAPSAEAQEGGEDDDGTR